MTFQLSSTFFEYVQLFALCSSPLADAESFAAQEKDTPIL